MMDGNLAGRFNRCAVEVVDVVDVDRVDVTC